MFVLAHLSDPHLGPIPTPRLAELVNKRGLGLINWYRKRHRHHRADVLDAIVADMKAHAPGHIAVTGDLVNVSLDSEFARAALWLDTLGKPEDVTLVPGNHDAYISRASGSAAQHWGDYMRGDDCAAFPFVRRRGPLALIGLTTSLPTGPFMATGRLGGEQLARLAEILITLSREPMFRVVLIHHPPVPNKRHYMKRLIDAPMLRALLAEHGAELVLHGHNHERQLMWLDGPKGRIPAVGVPSASAIISTHDEPAAYNLYRIDGGPGAWRCEMISRGLRAGHDGVVELTSQRLIGCEEFPASAKKVQDMAATLGLDIAVREMAESTRTAEEAAAACGVTVGQIVKSLVFSGATSGKPYLLLVSGANRVNEKGVATHLGEKLKRPDADAVRALTGFAIGGIPPFGHATPLATYIDRDLLAFDVVWAAAGTPKAVFRIEPARLRDATGAIEIDVK